MSNKKSLKSRLKRRFRRHPTPAGIPAVPGVITVDPQAPPPVVRLIAYGPEEFHEQPLDNLDHLTQFLGRLPVTWVNVDGLGDAQTIRRLGEIFHLHPLALEDVVHTHQRAKVEDYEGRLLFVVARMVAVVQPGQPDEQLTNEQISFFLGPNFVLSFQEGLKGDSLDPVRVALRKGLGRLRQTGPDYLLYSLLDAVIDAYFPVLEHYGERLDQLDEAVMGMAGSPIRQIHRIRSDLLQLRRAVWPLRDAINVLLRGGFPMITRETSVYLRDCYDHTIQLIDVLEVFRETCSDLRDYYYTLLSRRTNEIMRVLTIIATIFMPLSFIAGVYGMNFEFMPELHWVFGYPLALGLMLTVALGLLYYFWRRGWLFTDDTPEG